MPSRSDRVDAGPAGSAHRRGDVVAAGARVVPGMDAVPVADEALLVETTVEVPVQVNGKVRAVITVDAGADAAVLEAAAPRGTRRSRQHWATGKPSGSSRFLDGWSTSWSDSSLSWENASRSSPTRRPICPRPPSPSTHPRGAAAGVTRSPGRRRRRSGRHPCRRHARTARQAPGEHVRPSPAEFVDTYRAALAGRGRAHRVRPPLGSPVGYVGVRGARRAGIPLRCRPGRRLPLVGDGPRLPVLAAAVSAGRGGRGSGPCRARQRGPSTPSARCSTSTRWSTCGAVAGWARQRRCSVPRCRSSPCCTWSRARSCRWRRSGRRRAQWPGFAILRSSPPAPARCRSRYITWTRAERAAALLESLRSALPGLRSASVTELGAVIGAHLGPGVLGIVLHRHWGRPARPRLPANGRIARSTDTMPGIVHSRGGCPQVARSPRP